jgi:hypothetical protein
MAGVYRKVVPTAEAVRFDGTNGDDIVTFVGGEDYGVNNGETVTLTPAGKDPRGAKITVVTGQWVAKPKGGTTVINEAEFAADYELVPVLPEADPAQAPLTAKLEEPVPDDELEYQPGFGPLTEEDRKKAEEKAAADKKKDKKEDKEAHHHKAWDK